MNNTENKNSFFRLSTLFIAGGIFSGVVALTVSALLPLSFTASQTAASVVILVVIEEAAKFLMIYGILRTYSFYNFFKLPHYLFYPAAIGFGFGLFELLIITMGAVIPTPEMLRPTLVHIATSLLFGIGFYLTYKSKSITFLASFFLLSVAAHVWYNVVVLAEIF